MSTPWIVGLIVAALFFAFFESRAFWAPTQNETLSSFIRRIAATYPITIYVMGFCTGGLVIHLFACGCTR